MTRYILLIALALATSAAPAAAQHDSAPTSPSAFVVYCYDPVRDLAVRELASDCRGRVVTAAEAKKIENRRNQELDRELAIGTPSAAQPVPARHIVKTGTGFFVDAGGALLTNEHVISGCQALMVEPAADQSSRPAKVASVDAADDLALIDTEMPAPQVAEFQKPGPLGIGAFAAVVGYPDQGLPTRLPVVTSGLLERPSIEPPSGGGLMVKADVRPGDS
ncbi:MAG: S1 family peptidase, partial [Stellaceae bacterium]